jgi:hypothetical protein
MALGALIIQTKFHYSDLELVEQLSENPYLQYFIGLSGYQNVTPFDATTLVLSVNESRCVYSDSETSLARSIRFFLNNPLYSL